MAPPGGEMLSTNQNAPFQISTNQNELQNLLIFTDPKTHTYYYRDVNYCTEKAASVMVNDRRFRQLDVVVDDAYEIEMNKKTVTYTLPVHVGFFVLQYAKMRMLQFYYDFTNRYLERPLFQYCVCGVV